jgi:hypothetical protein
MERSIAANEIVNVAVYSAVGNSKKHDYLP